MALSYTHTLTKGKNARARVHTHTRTHVRTPWRARMHVRPRSRVEDSPRAGLEEVVEDGRPALVLQAHVPGCQGRRMRAKHGASWDQVNAHRTLPLPALVPAAVLLKRLGEQAQKGVERQPVLLPNSDPPRSPSRLSNRTHRRRLAARSGSAAESRLAGSTRVTPVRRSIDRSKLPNPTKTLERCHDSHICPSPSPAAEDGWASVRHCSTALELRVRWGGSKLRYTPNLGP